MSPLRGYAAAIPPGAVLRLSLAVLLGLAAAFARAAAADAHAVLGRVGFDWSDPGHAACVVVDERVARTLDGCAPADADSFTGRRDHLVCRHGKGEFLAFPTRERCVEELETMEANGD
jgi:hypothetical protein